MFVASTMFLQTQGRASSFRLQKIRFRKLLTFLNWLPLCTASALATLFICSQQALLLLCPLSPRQRIHPFAPVFLLSCASHPPLRQVQATHIIWKNRYPPTGRLRAQALSKLFWQIAGGRASSFRCQIFFSLLARSHTLQRKRPCLGDDPSTRIIRNVSGDNARRRATLGKWPQ